MNRRRVLVAIGSSIAAGSAAAAGCLAPTSGIPSENGDGNGSGDGNDSDGGENGSENGDGNGSGDGGETENGGPFADDECPSFVENADRTVCWHTSDPDSEPIRLAPSPAVLDLDADDGAASIEFALKNGSETPVGLNPYAWAIKRRTEEGYEHVAPDAYVEPWTTIEPGASFAWDLSIEGSEESTDGSDSSADGSSSSEGGTDDDRRIAIAHELDPGTYAFRIVGVVGEETPDSTRIEFVALFRIE